MVLFLFLNNLIALEIVIGTKHYIKMLYFSFVAADYPFKLFPEKPQGSGRITVVGISKSVIEIPARYPSYRSPLS